MFTALYFADFMNHQAKIDRNFEKKIKNYQNKNFFMAQKLWLQFCNIKFAIQKSATKKKTTQEKP